MLVPVYGWNLYADRCLHKAAADEVEGLLGGELADAVAIAAECALGGFVLLRVGYGDVDQAHGFVFSAAGGAGDAGYADSQGCAGAEADAVSECFGHFSRDCAVLCDEFRRDAGKRVLEGVRIDYGASEKRAGAAGDTGDAFGNHAAGAAFSNGDGELAEAEIKQDDLLKGFAVRGVEPLFQGFFHLPGQFIDAVLGKGGAGLGADEGELNISGVGENGGFHVLVRGVDGGEKLVSLRLGNHGGAQGALSDETFGDGGTETGKALVVKERPALAGRPGDEQDDLAIAGKPGVKPLAGGTAVGVGKDGGALKNISLLEVVGGHGHARGSCAGMEGGDQGGVPTEREREGLRDGLAGEGVLGRAEAAYDGQDVRAAKGDANGVDQVLATVAHNGLEVDGDAYLIELLSEIERVCVLTPWS